MELGRVAGVEIGVALTVWSPLAELSKAAVHSDSFYFGMPVAELPSQPADIMRVVRDELQAALDGAVAGFGASPR